jgi:hypothetical protein
LRYFSFFGALFIATFIAVPATPPALAQDSFAGFIIGLRDVCAEEPARTCTGQVSSFLDSDNDRQVSLPEFEAVRAQAKSAVTEKESGLSAIERNLISVALLIFNQAKLPAVFARFDADNDGGLSEDELFADFQRDQRPMAKIIADPDSVDWKSFAGRFGKLGFLVLDLLPPSHRK